jgi:hypothetical protein
MHNIHNAKTLIHKKVSNKYALTTGGPFPTGKPTMHLITLNHTETKVKKNWSYASTAHYDITDFVPNLVQNAFTFTCALYNLMR